MDSTDRDLHSISYRSFACGDIGDAALEHIHLTAQHHNRKRSITGGLLFDGLAFFQTLEGRRSDVLSVMSRIQHDRRHHKIIPFGIRPIASRFFNDWSMKLVRPGANAASVLAEFGRLDLRAQDVLDEINAAIRTA